VAQSRLQFLGGAIERVLVEPDSVQMLSGGFDFLEIVRCGA